MNRPFSQLIQADNFDKIVAQIIKSLSLLAYWWNFNLVPNFKEQDLELLTGDSHEHFNIKGILAISFLIEK